jgi:transcriptional regulator with XRE-family HTH domain
MYKRIIEARRRLHLSQKYVSEILGISIEDFDNFEKGEGYLNLEKFKYLCNKVYGKGVIEFIFNSEYSKFNKWEKMS